MQIRFGYELCFECPKPTPMILMLSVHPSRLPDLLVADELITDPWVARHHYQDGFGNRCTRLVAPAGPIRLTAQGVVRDSGLPDPQAPLARQHPVEVLPDDTLIYLLGSRYCETDLLSQTAWQLFESTPPGWARVQAICDFVHQHIHFAYEEARATRTALEVFRERKGVCRDYTHLAITFCRCLNIPARYCTGHLGDMGTPPPYPPGDFAAWMEVYLDGQWHTFDPRNNAPRIGRVLIARGRDAQDVPLCHAFGFNTLKHFRVWCDEEVQGNQTGIV